MRVIKTWTDKETDDGFINHKRRTDGYNKLRIQSRRIMRVCCIASAYPWLLGTHTADLKIHWVENYFSLHFIKNLPKGKIKDIDFVRYSFHAMYT